MMCHVPVHQVRLVIVIMCMMTCASAMTYYVTPTSSSQCPEEVTACLTLSQYTEMSNFSSETTLILLPGGHSLDSVLWISNITYLSVTVVNTTQTSVTTTVTCSRLGRFHFEYVKQVSMHNLLFFGCVNNMIESVNWFTLENSDINGQGRDGTGLNMNVVTNADIVQSTFSSSTGLHVSHPFRPWVIAKGGGAINIVHANVSISSCQFSGNTADIGGAIFCLQSYVTIDNCTFNNNLAVTDGGGVYAAESTTMINGSVFFKNAVTESISFGGAVEIFNGTSSIDNCFFKNNSAGLGGGAVNLFNSNQTHHMSNNEFVNNSASAGTVIFIEATTLKTTGYLNIHENQHGTIFAFNCRMNFSGNTTITNNAHTNSSQLQQDGGAITCFRTEITFNNVVTITHNKAKNGGAISSTESRLNFHGNVYISYNSANESGGGFNAFLSELNFLGRTDIAGNRAAEKGGGIHSVDATVRLVQGALHFTDNHANKGGGMYLTLNSKLQIVKTATECVIGNHCLVRDLNKWKRLEFAYNSAEYGGALFVSDETTSSTCNSIPFRAKFGFGECFFQSFALHPLYEDNLNLLNIYFNNNTATIAGKSLYGGLLDRCTVSSFAEIFRVTKYRDLTPNSIDAISYFLNLTNVKREDLQSEISSDPVRVCFCKNNQPDCSYNPPTVFVRKGETFNVSLVAVDQVNNTIPNTIIHNSVSGLSDRCLAKSTINDSCTSLDYNIFSLEQEEQLHLHAGGPCQEIGISERSINIQLKSCPIGFQNSKMECKCDPILFPEFVANCSIDNESVIRKEAVWISLLNVSSEKGYIIYQNCPFDYCHQPTDEVHINLNIPNGADAQCAFNRSGKLCGACRDGLSLSLGSSHCKSCTNNWLALLIVFAIAGVALVAFLLVFNLAVAVGTINGLIFYANIIAANSTIFFPTGKPSFLSIFIAWLNLDFGFESCFYAGLDGYAKTWLQFLFPVYILLLVLGIVIACEYFPRFALLLSNRNPVATLATLILLSYAKLLRTVIASLSFAVLEKHINYGKMKATVVWLIDANIGYFQGKHIPLFITALFVLILGLVYTFLLLLWQWLQRLSNKKCLRWTRNAKLNSFMEAYHAPYKRHHRYWTGLLLLVRAILYLVAALNVISDPSNTLLSIACVVGSLILLKEILKDKVYRQWALSSLESSFIFNIVIFSTATLYVREAGGNQTALAYTSTSIAFLAFLLILIYHAIANFKPLQKITNKLKVTQKKTTTMMDLKSMNSFVEIEQSSEFSQLRRSMEIFEDEPMPDGSYTPPNTARSSAVTYTVVDPIPSHSQI